MHSVVVGVSTSDGRPMVRWAAEEAEARRAGLRLVTACPAPAASDRYLPDEVADEHRASAVALLAGLAADVTPGLAVTTELVVGPPAAVLRDAAADADLLVVGADDASPFVEAISGSVPGDLLTSAPCPLAVVPRREWAVPAAAPVVVALDESTAAQAALAYGYAAADRTGRPLTVLRCVDGEPSTQPRALLAFEALYPGVTVSTELSRGDPRQVLTAASRQAALLVVGSRRRGRLASSVFGSVSRHLIRHGGCPVVVAHTQHPVALSS